MRERDFFDTNILLYAKIDDESEKHHIAKNLVILKTQNNEPNISVQVLNEFTVNAIKKGKPLPEVETVVKQLIQSFYVLQLSTEITMDAFRISDRYQFSFWDSLIVASALATECSTVYTEDLQDGQIIDSVLKISNPFIGLSSEKI
jgi:predicted nucleic acid-binding protein